MKSSNSMKVYLQRQNDAVHFEGKSPEGHAVQMDGSENIGGVGKGVRPTEMVLMAVGGWSSIDIHLILKKMRQKIEDFSVEIEGEKADAIPAVFEKIILVYHLKGEMTEKKVRRAIDLSLEKYCSVSKMLEKSVQFSYAFTINGERYEQIKI